MIVGTLLVHRCEPDNLLIRAIHWSSVSYIFSCPVPPAPIVTYNQPHTTSPAFPVTVAESPPPKDVSRPLKRWLDSGTNLSYSPNNVNWSGCRTVAVQSWLCFVPNGQVMPTSSWTIGDRPPTRNCRRPLNKFLKKIKTLDINTKP